MTEVEVNGSGVGDVDLASTKIALASSSTSRRIGHLRLLEERLVNDDTTKKLFPYLLRTFFNTYPYYYDRHSRLAVESCLQNIFKLETPLEILEDFLNSITAEASKSGLAPSNAFVLVRWCSLLLPELCRNPQWQGWALNILSSNSHALELCISMSLHPNIRRSALVSTKTGLAKAFEARPGLIKEAIDNFSAKGTLSSPRNAVILGVIADVGASKAELKKVLFDKKSEIFAFYNREIIGSRSRVAPHIANALEQFFGNFATTEDVEKEITPSMEKALLRSPEIVLDDLLTPLFRSLPDPIDLSITLQEKLLKPFLANMKSTNATIRLGALSAFKAAVLKCHNMDVVSKITEEVLTPLKSGKLSSPDQRAMHAEMLGVLPLSKANAATLASALAIIAGKETNEVALIAETLALLHCLAWVVRNEPAIDKSVVDAFAKGSSDKKIPIKRIWIVRLGELLSSCPDVEILKSRFLSLGEATIAPLMEVWKEAIANPLALAQSGLITAAYVFTVISQSKLPVLPSSKIDTQLKKAQVSDQALVSEPKPSFLLNHRIYGKLSTEDEFQWFVRALSALSRDIVNKQDEATASAWSQAFIYCICSSSISPSLRKETCCTLSRLYVQNPDEISKIIISGLWRWRHSVELLEKDGPTTAAKTNNDNLHLVVRSICLSSAELSRLGGVVAETVRKQQMISMLVLARPELLPRVSWIDLSLRVEIDPGELARSHGEALLRQILEITDFQEEAILPQSDLVKKAAFNAAADLAFVAPDAMTPRIVDLIQRDLSPVLLAAVGPTEAAIYRTPEGTAFVDILASKSQSYVPNKNVKDYDTLKWEEDLRAQLAQKKGQQKKLTTEESAKVNAQLKKESGIRLKLRNVVARLMRGIGIIESLATGPPTEASLWMSPAVKALVDIIAAGAGLLTGNAAPNAYILCAERLATRIGTLRRFIGVATLRALRVPNLPDALIQEPLGALVTRVLYRLRFSGEQRPFDTVTLTYILPLVFLVLRQGGFGENDDAETQVVLALEFLTVHTDACSDILVPRQEVLAVLISSMQQYNQHYKLIKDCLADLCRCIAPNITNEEISILVQGAIVPQVSVRTSVLQSISTEIDMSDLEFSDEVWLACHDDLDENVGLGREIWEESGFEISTTSPSKILKYLESPDKQLRRAAARSLAESVSIQPSTFTDILQQLQSSYEELAKPRVPQLDEYGMPKKIDLSDPWEARNGIAISFKELAPSFKEDLLDSFLQFLIENGPLGDRNPSVREEMVEAGSAIIALHGKNKVEDLMKTFERTLETPDKASDFADRVNEAVIILYGALARHLRSGDSRLPLVVDRLLETLSTPSETVQYAVAECLPPLVRASSGKTPDYIDHVLKKLLGSKKYAGRRGAAYGLAGIVHGKGILALREYRILATLQGAAENKKDVNNREGALLAYELLSTILGRVFEPYVIQIVPQLLSSFGDSSADVREACLAAAKACFASLSSYGVKRILPTLLEGLEDQQWRSKKGACDLLGAMAYLDPQQLAQSLPEIIPPLTGVLNDSHKEVRLAANRSLKRFGEVISNPEIKSLVDVLLKALSDPTKYTDNALDSLIKVSFVHYLDAPSLALVARILERGLGDRSATKRKSAQVIGSLAHLAERKDLVAHLPILVAGLKVAIVDPVPTTRATASKALGSLIEKLGEDALPDLIPGLMQTLKSDTGAGDRLGSAQALSEVLAGLGTGRLEETLPTILQNVASSKSSVREGFMSLFIFLPVCFGNSFANYLSKIIPPILSGLADEVESIRDTSLRAGRLLVKNFATKSIDLLLPELERGLADDSYRIRLSSVELVGDLLFNLTGISANAEDEVEEGAQEAGASLLEVLGEEKRNKVLSSLYICRCDTSGLVRTAAVNVWKALVASPRTLKELIPTLTQLIIRRLGSSNMEQKIIAGNSLGELIRKAGDGVLSTLLPTLEEGLQTSTDTDARQGICIALKELISSASPDALEDHEKTLISVVRIALIDQDEDVREAAAEAFDSLQQVLGKKAVDQVLPHLLSLLRTESEADNALSALLTLLTESTRSNIILPNLIPTLTKSPISSFNAKALASLSTVAGPAMTRRLPNILNSLMDEIIACKDDDLRADLNTSFDTVILSIDEFDGLNTTMSVLLALAKHDDHRRRAATGHHLANFFADSTVDYSRYNQDIIRALLISFDDRDVDVVKAAWTALSEFTKRLKKEEMEALVHSTKQVLQHVGVAGSNLPGFGLPKGINAILPIFLQGLMNGTSEQRIQSALAISDIVDRTSADSLKPFVTQITGPLIRAVSERSVDVKAAILLTLNNILEKIPTFLKPFLPQLQRTFAKSLADPSSEVLRTRAAKALGTLITLTPRIDPLIAELVTGSRTSDSGVRNAMLKALFEVISKAGANMGEASRAAVLSLIDADPEDNDVSMAITNAKLLGALIKNVPLESATGLIKNRVMTTHFSQSSVLALNAVLLESPSSLTESGSADDLPGVICQGMSSKNNFVSDNCVLAAGKYLLTETRSSDFEQIKPLFETLATLIAPGNSVDTRRLALVVIRTICRHHMDTVRPHLPLLAAPVFASVRDPVIPVKLAAEAAFMALFNVVDDESKIFDKYIANHELPPNQKRSMQDYFKRVALRLANTARERKEAEGGQGGLGLSMDEVDDEREIWSVGKVDLGETIFDGE